MNVPRRRESPSPDISGVSVADNRHPPEDRQHDLDALAAPTCIVDPGGFIVAVNRSWRAFTADNNGAVSSCGLGMNYLRVCDVNPRQEGNHDASAAQQEVLDTLDGRDVADGLRAVLSGGSDEHVREYPCHAPGAERWFIVRIVPVLTHSGRGAMISHTDVTADRRTRDALSHQALHDALTGLPNRLLLSDRLSQALADSERQRTHVGLAFLDLDHFKRINDNLGHATGDALLVAVAERLHALVRDGDTLARYSGDEFVALWRDLDGPATATALGERLGRAMKKSFEVIGHSIEVMASIGIAVAQPGQSGDDLLLAADAAMYDAKRHGRGQARTFSGELRAGAQSRVATEVGRRAAQTRDELVLHNQPSLL
jgi:diguanylate cyclase (GGDEF)-like protein